MRDKVGLVLFVVSESGRNAVFTYNLPAYHNDSDSECLASIKSCSRSFEDELRWISSLSVGLVKAIPARVKGYVRENWGTPFIAGFMIILLVAAASMVTGSEALANELANYAYFALVVGVVLQLVCFLKYNKGNCEKNYESS